MHVTTAILADEAQALHRAVTKFLAGRADIFVSVQALIEALEFGQYSRVILFSGYGVDQIDASSGYGVAMQIRDQLSQDLTTIMISHELGINEDAKAHYAGVTHVLVTPFDPVQLEAVI